MMRALLLCLMLVGSVPLLAADKDDAKNVPRYVGFPIIIVNTSDGLSYNGLFAVKVQLQVTGDSAHGELEALRPQLHDALTRATFRLGQLYIDPRRPVPWARMLSELNGAVKQVAPKIPARVLVMETTTRPS
jgi:hypothetical protein